MEPTFAYENQTVKGKIYALPVYIENHKLELLIAVDSEVELGQTPCKLDEGTVVCSQNTDASKGTVLVVDDSRMSRKMLRTILEEGGYAVIAEAANGEEGLEAYKQYHPSVVTMDITMPKMDGITALRELKAYDSNARVVMITAAGQQQKIIEALKLGAERFITKPFDQNEVMTTLELLIK
ncbi:MAG: response regulator [Acetatifactor sp.]|nr:response regulator [Acetatifactor sp.]